MILNAHAGIGFAQIAFYVPILLAASYLTIRKHGRPRAPWRSLLIFSVVRITGGALLVTYEQHQESVTYLIVALIFQGTGIFPLILSTLGLFKIICSQELPSSIVCKYALTAIHFILYTGVGLVTSGSVLQGKYKEPDSVKTGLSLAKAGFIIWILSVVVFIAFALYLYKRLQQTGRSATRMMIMAVIISMPFLIIRIIYSCLTVFTHGNKKNTWSPLYGSVAAFIIMHFLMEFAVVLIYLRLGFAIPPIGKGVDGHENLEAQSLGLIGHRVEAGAKREHTESLEPRKPSVY